METAIASNWTSPSNILGLLDATTTVLVVGPIIVNETLYGNCKRIASDFPLPVFEDMTRVLDIGGPGNVVKNIKALGFHVDFITIVGEGDQYAVDAMVGEKIDTSGTVTCPGYTVAKKIRYICNSYVSFRANEGDEDFKIDKNVERDIVSVFQRKLESSPYSVVILSDYRFGMLSENVTSAIISLCNSKAVPVIVDPPKFGNFYKFGKCTLFKPNLDEAKYFLGRKIVSEDEIREACCDISKRLLSRYVVITLAERGMALFDKTLDSFGIIPAQSGVNVVDVNGAGDTTLAALAVGISITMELANMCTFANICAANVIERHGTVTVNLIDVIRSQDGVLTRRRDVESFKRLLDVQDTIVLVMDDFDPLTTLHLSVLRKAKAFGKYCVVAVDCENAQESDERVEFVLELLASNKFVDFVIVLKDIDRKMAVGILQPNFLCEIDIDGKNINAYNH